jgi:hypothetical protein
MMSGTRHWFSYAMLAATIAVGTLSAAPAAARDDSDGGLPNVFISPHGEPFRAAPGAPYPIADWFKRADRNSDGKLDKAEFLADAEAFFKVLDVNDDGVIGSYEVAFYEHRIAPEILVPVGNAAADGGPFQAVYDGGVRLWRVQIESNVGRRPRTYGGATGPGDSIDPGGGQPNEPTRRREEDSVGKGAAPYSLFNAPEPVTSADPDFLFRGYVRKASFMARAERNFAALDTAGEGFLTLARLPKTPMQQLIENARRR